MFNLVLIAYSTFMNLFFIVIMIIFTICVIGIVISTRHTKKVKQTSGYYKSLLDLNTEYKKESYLEVNTSNEFYKNYKYKNTYKNAKVIDFIKAHFEENFEWYKTLLNNYNLIVKRYEEYCEKFQWLIDLQENQQSTKANKRFLRVENKLIYKGKHICPYKNLNYRYIIDYESPKGRVYEYDMDTLNYEKMKYYLNEARKNIDYKKTKEYFVKTQRNKVTDKLRYEILRRDKFRCVLCGISREDSKLEVDHIKPVSKGGKTERSNLRTLCNRCNRGKGARYNENGLN